MQTKSAKLFPQSRRQARPKPSFGRTVILAALLALGVAGAAGSALAQSPYIAPQTGAALWPGPSVTIWHPHQLQLYYQPQSITLPQWQLQPVWLQQHRPYLQPNFKKVTAVTYRPRLVLEPVELEAWQLQWQQAQYQQQIRAWKPQLGQQKIQVWRPQWRLVTSD